MPLTVQLQVMVPLRTPRTRSGLWLAASPARARSPKRPYIYVAADKQQESKQAKKPLAHTDSKAKQPRAAQQTWRPEGIPLVHKARLPQNGHMERFPARTIV